MCDLLLRPVCDLKPGDQNVTFRKQGATLQTCCTCLAETAQDQGQGLHAIQVLVVSLEVFSADRTGGSRWPWYLTSSARR